MKARRTSAIRLLHWAQGIVFKWTNYTPKDLLAMFHGESISVSPIEGARAVVVANLVKLLPVILASCVSASQSPSFSTSELAPF